MEDLLFIMEELTLNCFAAARQGHVPPPPRCLLEGFTQSEISSAALQLLKPVGSCFVVSGGC